MEGEADAWNKIFKETFECTNTYDDKAKTGYIEGLTKSRTVANLSLGLPFLPKVAVYADESVVYSWEDENPALPTWMNATESINCGAVLRVEVWR